MKVTRFQYPLEASLIHKIDLMILRCIQRSPKKDAVLLNEGAEGEGKTSLSVAEAYYISEKTKRPFNHKHIFCDTEKMIKFLQDTEGQIAIWDEPALQALSSDALTSVVKDVKRMLMMCRNRRHFIIINMTYFNEFGNYIVWQRPLGMVHVYSRNEIQPGRFIYIKKKYLERLWLDWRTKKQRNYKKYAAKRIRGTFPDVLNPDYKFNVLSEFDFDEYEKNKNEAINSIRKETKKLSERDIKRKLLMEMIIKNETSRDKITDKLLMKALGVPNVSFYRLKKACQVSPISKVPLNNNMGNNFNNFSNYKENRLNNDVVTKNVVTKQDVVPKLDYESAITI